MENEEFPYPETMKKLYEDLAAYEKDISDHNEALIKSFSKGGLNSFNDLIDGSNVTGKIEYVDRPRGDRQNESYGVFNNVHVDQYSVGDSGDSFAGTIYANVKGKWIAIPYEC